MASRLGRAAVASLVAVVGCSGGGTADDGPLRVQFSPATLSRGFAQGDHLSGTEVTVTFSRPIPNPEDPQAYAFTFQQEPGSVLDFTNGLWLDPQPTVWRMTLWPSCGLGPGVYEGTITFVLYDRVSFAKVPLTGNVLPYAFTVSPGVAPPRVTAAVDGVPQPGFDTICGRSDLSLDLSNGQTLSLTSTVPVTWRRGVGFPCGAVLQDVVETPTTLTGTLLTDYRDSGVACTIRVDATLVEDPTRTIEVWMTVVPP
jgi:hypothetical protein